MTAYVLEKPQYFLKGYTAQSSGESDDSIDDDNNENDNQNDEQNDAENNSDEETPTAAALTAADIVNDYARYGDMYDLADNDIGMNVSYILLKLTATENTASSSAAEPENPEP